MSHENWNIFSFLYPIRIAKCGFRYVRIWASGIAIVERLVLDIIQIFLCAIRYNENVGFLKAEENHEKQFNINARSMVFCDV